MVSFEWFLNKVLGKLVLPGGMPGRYSVRLKRNYRLRKFESSQNKTLEIGGGRFPLSSDHLNVDGLDAPEVDVVHRFPEPMPFPENYADRIITVATLEHFNVPDLRRILVDFHRVLIPAGVLEISVPLLDKILAMYEKGGCTDELLRYLHGGQKDESDIHLSVLSTKRWCSELEDAGFVDAQSAVYDEPLHNRDFMGKVKASKSHSD